MADSGSVWGSLHENNNIFLQICLVILKPPFLYLSQMEVIHFKKRVVWELCEDSTLISPRKPTMFFLQKSLDIFIHSLFIHFTMVLHNQTENVTIVILKIVKRHLIMVQFSLKPCTLFYVCTLLCYFNLHIIISLSSKNEMLDLLKISRQMVPHNYIKLLQPYCVC